MNNLPAGAEYDPSAPWNNEEKNKCLYCGDPCHKIYCDKHCYKADLS